MIEISESKIEKMSEYAEKMLKYGGKLMSCLEELGDDHMGERDNYGRGGSMGYRSGRDSQGYRGSMGMRDSEDWDDMDMGERRGVKGTGRYSRYRGY